MSFLLDTNVCIAAINGTPVPVRTRLETEVARKTCLAISTVVAFELWYGVFRSRRHESNAARLSEFLAGPLDFLAFDEEDAERAGEIRAILEGAGTPIGPYDTLIAAQALRHDLTLVTANVGEFARVPGLRLENWSIVP